MTLNTINNVDIHAIIKQTIFDMEGSQRLGVSFKIEHFGWVWTSQHAPKVDEVDPSILWSHPTDGFEHLEA